MNEGNYNSVLQGLYEEKSSLMYNLQRSDRQRATWKSRLDEINEAIEELEGNRGDYIGNRESDY